MFVLLDVIPSSFISIVASGSDVSESILFPTLFLLLMFWRSYLYYVVKEVIFFSLLIKFWWKIVKAVFERLGVICRMNQFFVLRVKLFLFLFKCFINTEKWIIKTDKHFFECGVDAILIRKSQRRGSNGGIFTRYSKLFSGA